MPCPGQASWARPGWTAHGNYRAPLAPGDAGWDASSHFQKDMGEDGSSPPGTWVRHSSKRGGDLFNFPDFRTSQNLALRVHSRHVGLREPNQPLTSSRHRGTGSRGKPPAGAEGTSQRRGLWTVCVRGVHPECMTTDVDTLRPTGARSLRLVRSPHQLPCSTAGISREKPHSGWWVTGEAAPPAHCLASQLCGRGAANKPGAQTGAGTGAQLPHCC